MALRLAASGSRLPALPTSLPRLLATGCFATATTLVLALGTLSPVLSQDSAPPERLTPAQKEKIFPELKKLSIRQQEEREKIQQQNKRCVSSASNQQALRDCMKEERKANQELRNKFRDEKRRIYERNGIKVPVGGPGKGKKANKGA